MKKKQPDLIKDPIEPLKNLDFHLSPIGIMSNKLFNDISRVGTVIEQMKDFLRILNPKAIHNNILDFKKLRDDMNKPPQTRIFYHNRLQKIFDNAGKLFSDVDEKDTKFFGLNKKEMQDIYIQKRKEYEVDTYRKNDFMK